MDKKELIIQRSYDLFEQYGVIRVTMDLIADKCGISKKTIYKYFENKDDLLHQVVKIKVQELYDELADYSKTYPNALQAIQAFLGRTYYVFTNTFLNFIRDLKRFHSDSYQLIMDLREDLMLSFIEENITQGKEIGIYRIDLNASQLSKSYNRIFMALLSKGMNINSECNMQPIAFLNQLFIYRLLSDDGLKVWNSNDYSQENSMMCG